MTRCSFILYLRLTKKSHRMPISRRGRHCCPGLVTRFMGQEQPSLKGVWIRILKNSDQNWYALFLMHFPFFFYLFILSFDQSLLLGLLRQWWIRLVLEYMRNNNEPDGPQRFTQMREYQPSIHFGFLSQGIKVPCSSLTLFALSQKKDFCTITSKIWWDFHTTPTYSKKKILVIFSCHPY